MAEFSDFREAIKEELFSVAKSFADESIESAQQFANNSVIMTEDFLAEHSESPNFEELSQSLARQIQLEAAQLLALREAAAREQVFGIALGIVRTARIFLAA